VAARAQPVCPTHPRGSTRRMRHTPPPFATPSTRGSCGWMETVMGGAARSRHGGATAATRGDADTEANATLEVEKLLDSEQPRLWSNLDGTASSLARDKGSMSGAVFLVAGTTVGAGILALPAETQPSGFVASTVAIVVCWAYMVRRRSHTRTRCCSPHVPRVPSAAWSQRAVFVYHLLGFGWADAQLKQRASISLPLGALASTTRASLFKQQEGRRYIEVHGWWTFLDVSPRDDAPKGLRLSLRPQECATASYLFRLLDIHP
jgi:hypothetical protein